MPTPEEPALVNIDKQLTACGWVIQDMAGLNRYASLGVAVREFPLDGSPSTAGKGSPPLRADYLLFVDGKAAGVIEAKPAGTTLSGVADQSSRYVASVPKGLPHVQEPLPF